MLAVTKASSWFKGIYLGWWVILASALLQVLNGGVLFQGYGAYVAVLQEQMSWNKTIFALGFSVQQIIGGIMGLFHGRLVERFGVKSLVRVGFVVMAVGFVMFSQLSTLLSFFSAMVVLAIGSALSGFLSLNVLPAQWFERWRSTAFALLQTGISASGFVVPLVAWSLAAYGWQNAILGIAVLVVVIGLPLTLLLHRQPEDFGLVPDGQARSELKATFHDEEFSAQEALRTRAFWFVGAGHALALMVVSAVLVHLVVHLQEGLGLSLQQAANMLAVLTGVSILGQLLGGILGDKMNKRMVAAAAMLGHAIALLLLAFASSMLWVYGFIVLHGLSWGLRAPIMQALRADYFGRHSFAKVMGYSAALVTMGMMSGPLIAGIMADLFGNYQAGFVVLSGFATLGSVFFIFATKPVKGLGEV